MLFDTSTLVMGIIFILAIFGPVVYLAWKGKSRLKKASKIIREVEKTTGFKFSNQESWSDRAIGIDPQNKKLIFVDPLLGIQSWKLIDLTMVSKCKNNDTGEVIQIGIVWNNNKLENLTIYDMNVDDPVDRGYHVLLLRKWTQLIEGSLTPRNKAPKRAA